MAGCNQTQPVIKNPEPVVLTDAENFTAHLWSDRIKEKACQLAKENLKKEADRKAEIEQAVAQEQTRWQQKYKEQQQCNR